MPVDYLSKATPENGAIYYLDTSAVIKLVSENMKAEGWPVSTKDQDDAARLKSFLGDAVRKGARLLTTVLVMEELASLVRNKLRAESAKAGGYSRWPDFKRSDRENADIADERAHVVMLKVMRWAVDKCSAVGVVFERSAVPVGETRASAKALRLAHAKLLQMHQQLDPMDALHIVLGVSLGAKDFISFDVGWEVVPNIKVYR